MKSRPKSQDNHDNIQLPMEHCPQAIRSADIPVGFAGAEFLIDFILPFAPIKADVAACLCKGRQVRAPGVSVYYPAFFRIIRLFGGQPAFARTPGLFWCRKSRVWNRETVYQQKPTTNLRASTTVHNETGTGTRRNCAGSTPFPGDLKAFVTRRSAALRRLTALAPGHSLYP